MLSPEILGKIKKLQIHTKKILMSQQVGDYKTRRRGFGLDFDQLRSYELGDDVRFIDWKSSARSNQLLVKQYFHESSKTIIIGLDCSSSMAYGSGSRLNYEYTQEIATILAFAGHFSKTAIGLIRFSDVIEEYIPPRSGNACLQSIINAIWQPCSANKQTSLACVLKEYARLRRKDSLAFLISDFIDMGSYEQGLSAVARHYDCIAIRCLDQLQKSFDFPASLQMEDPEQATIGLFDMKALNNAHFFHHRLSEQKKMCTKYGIDFLDMDSSQVAVDSLLHFFAARLGRS